MTLKRGNRIVMSLAVIAALFASLETAFAKKEYEVNQKDKKFLLDGKDINTLTLEPGDTIRFTNLEDGITHNVYSFGPMNKFDLQTQKPIDPETKKPRSSSIVPFEKEGTTEIACAIHPLMTLKVTIAKKK